MRKKLISVLWIIFLVLPFSCSDLILPKNVNVHGTMDLSIKVVADNWGQAVANILRDAFISNSGQIDMVDFNAEVYDVNYGQAEQTFLISIHSEISNHLNPGEYLKEAAAYLYQIGTSDPFEIFYEFDIGKLREQELSFPEQTVTIPGFASGRLIYVIPLPDMELELDIEDFLHTSVMDGDMEITVELRDGGNLLDSSTFKTEFDVNIEQENNSYDHDGLSCTIGPLNNVSLNGEHINNKHIKIRGSSVTITSTSGDPIGLTSGVLEVKATIKITTRKLKEVDLDFSAIGDKLNEHQIEPVSLDNVIPYVNYITYEPQSIGLQFVFDDMIDGLKMSIESGALGINPDFQELKKGNEIIFANKNAGTLLLNGNDPRISGYVPFTAGLTRYFDFDLTLKPKDGGNVLHIEPDGGLTPDKLKMNGKAEFFQDWREAQLVLTKIIKADLYEADKYIGSIPKENEEGIDPIDLSMLTDYITGFSFEGIQSEMYINGPHEVVNSLNKDGLDLTLKAHYWWDDGEEAKNNPLLIYEGGPLVLEENPLLLDASYFDANGSFKEKDLPPGKPVHFSEIMDEQPKNLVFIYEIIMPETLTVTNDLFENETDIINSKITVTILIMLPLKLTVKGNDPGTITFPDMFKDVDDLFGRSNLEDDSVFKTLDIEYLKFSIDFTGSFFNGGKLFIEKKGKELLYPNGINLNGKKIELNITGSDFDIIKNNLIDPDLRLIFENPGSSLNLPRNIGLTNIKFEAKGKFEL